MAASSEVHGRSRKINNKIPVHKDDDSISSLLKEIGTNINVIKARQILKHVLTTPDTLAFVEKAMGENTVPLKPPDIAEKKNKETVSSQVAKTDPVLVTKDEPSKVKSVLHKSKASSVTSEATNVSTSLVCETNDTNRKRLLGSCSNKNNQKSVDNQTATTSIEPEVIDLIDDDDLPDPASFGMPFQSCDIKKEPDSDSESARTISSELISSEILATNQAHSNCKIVNPVISDSCPDLTIFRKSVKRRKNFSPNRIIRRPKFEYIEENTMHGDSEKSVGTTQLNEANPELEAAVNNIPMEVCEKVEDTSQCTEKVPEFAVSQHEVQNNTSNSNVTISLRDTSLGCYEDISLRGIETPGKNLDYHVLENEANDSNTEGVPAIVTGENSSSHLDTETHHDAGHSDVENLNNADDAGVKQTTNTNTLPNSSCSERKPEPQIKSQKTCVETRKQGTHDKSLKSMKSQPASMTWTREQDREILLTCQRLGPTDEAFKIASKAVGIKRYQLVKKRFTELMEMVQKALNKNG